MTQQIRFVTLDVFTSKPYSGNPLAVVFLPDPEDPTTLDLTHGQKLNIAKEFNLSETVFLHPGNGPKRRIDIFTTNAEIPFAGHPTVGAAFWFQYLSPSQKDKHEVNCLVTKSGAIPITLQSGSTGSGVVAQIAHNVRLHAKRYPLSEVLRLHDGLTPFFAGQGVDEVEFPVFSVVNGMSQIHIELPSLEALNAVVGSSGGEVVDGESGYLDEGWRNGHCVLYFFVPNVYDELQEIHVTRTRMILGGLEDPATGSAASGLVAYLAMREGAAGTYKHHIVQGVEMGRRSDIGVEIALNEEGQIERLDLKGAAVPVAEGHIRIPPE